MILILSIAVFILFWWAILATIFCYQLNKENEDFARRLGKNLEPIKIPKPDYLLQMLESLVKSPAIKSAKYYLTNLNQAKIIKLIPLNLKFK